MGRNRALLFLFMSLCLGDVWNWKLPVTGSWHNETNWANQNGQSGVPGIKDTAYAKGHKLETNSASFISPGGATNQFFVTVDSAASVASLTVDNSALLRFH